MAITHSLAVRNALADLIDLKVNSGSTNAAGRLVVFDASGTELVRFTLQDPAFGSAIAGEITLQGVPISATGITPGTAHNFEVQDQDENMVFAGSVTATGGGGDVELDNTNISNGQTVNLTGGSYTAPN